MKNLIISLLLCLSILSIPAQSINCLQDTSKVKTELVLDKDSVKNSNLNKSYVPTKTEQTQEVIIFSLGSALLILIALIPMINQ